MDLKNLFSDEDAVSPVIGVILMVAITVILAAVIGTFVLGLGDQVQSSAPNANFQFQYNNLDTTDTNEVVVTHNGGQNVESSNVDLQVGSSTVTDSSDFSASTLSTGDTITYSGNEVSGGATVRVIWQSPNGGSSNTIGQSTVPN